MIDQYPNTKKVAAWLVGRYRDGCLEMKMIIDHKMRMKMKIVKRR